MTHYLRTCLACGGALEPVAGGPHSAPWRCDCGHAYYVAELTEEARQHYRPETHDFGGHIRVLREQIRAEAEEAHARGTSLRPEQIGLVPKASLQALLRRPVSPGMAHKIHQAIGS